MDKFKLRPGLSHIYPIERLTYEDATSMCPPYYSRTGKRPTLYAVCPECDNPIQIIGMFKEPVTGARKPYGKHVGHTIPDLAVYSKADYLNCSYANPNWRSTQDYRPKDSPIAYTTLSLLAEQFDRVVYILGKDTEIHIGLHLARQMLNNYISEEGWLYRMATPNNLPWTFAEASHAVPLFGQKILKSSEIYRAILDHCPDACFEDVPNNKYAKLVSKPGTYLDVQFLFCHHEKFTKDDALMESITFRVFYGKAPNTKTIFEKVIPIRTDYFMNLVCLSADKAHRNLDYLELSHTLLEEVLEENHPQALADS